MGTRSTIALEFADLTVQAVYCHWDGFRLQTLIDQGNLGSLGSEQAHEFSSWDHYCATHDGEQYDYCLRRDGTWWVRMNHGVHVPLADLLTASA